MALFTPHKKNKASPSVKGDVDNLAAVALHFVEIAELSVNWSDHKVARERALINLERIANRVPDHPVFNDARVVRFVARCRR